MVHVYIRLKDPDNPLWTTHSGQPSPLIVYNERTRGFVRSASLLTSRVTIAKVTIAKVTIVKVKVIVVR